MNGETKKDCYKSIFLKSIDDDSKRWHMIKELPSNTNPTSKNIILIDGQKIVADDSILAHCFITLFLNITESLGPSIPDSIDRLCFDELVTNAIEK